MFIHVRKPQEHAGQPEIREHEARGGITATPAQTQGSSSNQLDVWNKDVISLFIHLGHFPAAFEGAEFILLNQVFRFSLSFQTHTKMLLYLKILKA